MRNLLNFLARYNNLIIFLILEGVALVLLVNGNSYHNTKMIRGTRALTAGIEERISNARSYFRLNEINHRMALENALVRNQLERIAREEGTTFFPVTDTLYSQQYVYTGAVVINNSVNRQKNYFTINKGTRQGLSPDMAVISGSSVAGVIVGSSENFSVAMPVINIDFRISARIRSSGYFGSLTWDGKDYRFAILNEIPQHVAVNKGDTIESTGYSAVFPEGMMIGTVSGITRPGGDFYSIEVQLLTDFKKLRYVNVIGNMKKTERLELENSYQ